MSLATSIITTTSSIQSTLPTAARIILFRGKTTVVSLVLKTLQGLLILNMYIINSTCFAHCSCHMELLLFYQLARHSTMSGLWQLIFYPPGVFFPSHLLGSALPSTDLCPIAVISVMPFPWSSYLTYTYPLYGSHLLSQLHLPPYHLLPDILSNLLDDRPSPSRM